VSFAPGATSLCVRMTVDERRRGSRATLALLRSCYGVARLFGAEFNLIYCAPRLEPFFARLGYRQHAPAFDDPEVGRRIPMTLVMEDVAHIRAVHSPFAAVAASLPNSPAAADWFAAAFPTSDAPACAAGA
jgi:hypothetical protein